jgi:hypothetical protein
MTRNLTQKEVEVLKVLLDYGMLTVSQCALLCFPSRQMARKKIRELANRGLVWLLSRDFNQCSGRPEAIVMLSATAQQLLNDSKCLGREISSQHMTGTDLHDSEHQILINWTRLHLNCAEKKLTQVKINFLSPSIHFDNYHIKIDESGLGALIIPDGIFSITDLKQGKSLLFFLEVDMGTESMTSSNPGKGDIKRKILAYQHVFGSKLYKGLEDQFKATFTGFRTLFISETESRLQQLCRLIRSMPSADFIWLTEKNSLFEHGISDRIWVKGGKEEDGRYSILGPSLAFKCQIPPASPPKLISNSPFCLDKA